MTNKGEINWPLPLHLTICYNVIWISSGSVFGVVVRTSNKMNLKFFCIIHERVRSSGRKDRDIEDESRAQTHTYRRTQLKNNLNKVAFTVTSNFLSN